MGTWWCETVSQLPTSHLLSLPCLFVPCVCVSCLAFLLWLGVEKRQWDRGTCLAFSHTRGVRLLGGAQHILFHLVGLVGRPTTSPNSYLADPTLLPTMHSLHQ